MRTPATGRTYKDLVEEWGKVANLALSTEKTYASYLLRYLLPAFGSRDVSTITVQEVDVFYAALRATKLAPRTIQQIHAIFRRSLAVGVRWGWLPFNPVAMTSPEVRVASNEVQAPNPAEVQALYEECRRRDPLLGLFVLTSAYLGTRRGETCGLRWEDVNWEAPSILVRRSMTAQGRAKDTKTGAVGELAIPEQLMVALATAPTRGNGYFFQDRGIAWLPDTVTARVLEARDFLGLPRHVCLKNLRHFHATQLLARGADIGTVAARLRHTDKSTTMRFYSKRDEAADARAAASLEGLL